MAWNIGPPSPDVWMDEFVRQSCSQQQGKHQKKVCIKRNTLTYEVKSAHQEKVKWRMLHGRTLWRLGLVGKGNICHILCMCVPSIRHRLNCVLQLISCHLCTILWTTWSAVGVWYVSLVWTAMISSLALLDHKTKVRQATPIRLIPSFPLYWFTFF